MARRHVAVAVVVAEAAVLRCAARSTSTCTAAAAQALAQPAASAARQPGLLASRVARMLRRLLYPCSRPYRTAPAQHWVLLMSNAAPRRSGVGPLSRAAPHVAAASSELCPALPLAAVKLQLRVRPCGMCGAQHPGRL